MPRTPNETTPRQFRLGDDTLALLDRISDHYHLGSRAAAIRVAARTLAGQLPAPPGPARKTRAKSRRGD